MLTEEQIKLAIETGSQQADKIIALRDQKLKTRAAALAAKPQVARAIQTEEFKANFVDKLGPSASHVLVAEGDSWFDYPFHDILKILEDDHGFDVESVAHKGDRVEDMAYSDGQLDEFTRRIEKLLRNGSVPPKAILLSGGGNDVAGDEFGMLLNHKASSVAGLNHNVVNGIIDERIMSSYLTIIQRVTEICKSRVGDPLPILIHGYDYPVPDGRGYLGGWWFLPGPWFEPGFREKGFGIVQERINIVKDLIDIFNKMLQTVASRPEFEHVHFVDVRGTLSTLPDKYQADWENELHPTEKGFKAITAKFVQVINQL